MSYNQFTQEKIDRVFEWRVIFHRKIEQAPLAGL